MGYLLELKDCLKVPLDMSSIIPENLIEKSNEALETLELWEGNSKRSLDKFFTIKKTNDDYITLSGDLSKARRIGSKMKSGSLTVRGNAGLYVGEGMMGGKLLVEGDVGAWLGSRMVGGEISVSGDAGDFVGSSYRGSREGMKGGRIIVQGNAGDEIGCWMRGGMIRIRGNAGSFPGIHMIDGVIMIEGDCCGRAGAEMTGGKIIIQRKIDSKLSSFQTSTIKKKVKIEGTKIEGPFYLFEGDVNEQGSGKLYINKVHNTHLKWCEELIGEID